MVIGPAFGSGAGVLRDATDALQNCYISATRAQPIFTGNAKASTVPWAVWKRFRPVRLMAAALALPRPRRPQPFAAATRALHFRHSPNRESGVLAHIQGITESLLTNQLLYQLSYAGAHVRQYPFPRKRTLA